MVRIKPKKEINWVFIKRVFFCFIMIVGSLSIIYSAAQGRFILKKHFIISIICAIPLSILYAFFIEKLGSGLTNTILAWSSKKTDLSEQLSADMARARFSKGRKQFRDAILIINEILEKHPNFPEARLLKAQIAWEGFDNKELALRNLDKVMELVPDKEPIHRWALNYYHEVKKGRKPTN